MYPLAHVALMWRLPECVAPLHVLHPIGRAYDQRLYQTFDAGLDQYVQDAFGRSTQFAVMLSSWHLVVHRVKEDDSAFAQLLHSTITNFVGLDETLQRVAPPSKRTPMVRMNPALLYARLPNDHRCFVLSSDGSA
ncbi:unnamed protein product [Phytophthora fragariaefolia]|uniref:Unnamed protein product n=1 Tax=Phytophthora fragariaefolia TaxID=1490495 RepID=A0A9W6UA94_9STRA|nr:unnamed protein product [Phytophthora fragariaefolia]